MQRRIKINIREWLERKFDNVQNATTPDVKLNCPFCHDQKSRLYIAVEDGRDEKKGDGWCHNEQIRRDFFDLFAMMENISDGEAAAQLYDDNPEQLYGKAEQALSEYLKEEQVQEEEEIKVVWPSNYVRLFNLTPEQWKLSVPKYMVDRKLDQTMCDRYYLGYCMGRHKYSGRVIVPIYQHGILVGFQGRMMVEKCPKSIPKYLFMDGVKAGDYLFNLDAIPPEYDEVILTEGVFDVWGVVRCGFPNVVASFGKHLTEKGLKTLVRRFKSVLIMWDSDAKKEICELGDKLEGMVRVRVSDLAGKDPDEAKPEDVQKAIQNAHIYDKQYKLDVLSGLI